MYKSLVGSAYVRAALAVEVFSYEFLGALNRAVCVVLKRTVVEVLKKTGVGVLRRTSLSMEAFPVRYARLSLCVPYRTPAAAAGCSGGSCWR